MSDRWPEVGVMVELSWGAEGGGQGRGKGGEGGGADPNGCHLGGTGGTKR